MPENVLDLSGVFDEDSVFTVREKAPPHREWRVEADLPGRFLKTLFEDGYKWEQGQLSPQIQERMYTGLWHILRRSQECTLDEVMDAFSTRDVGHIIGELFIRLGFSPVSTATPATETEEQTMPAATNQTTASQAQTPTPPSISRQRRRASARRSAKAS